MVRGGKIGSAVSLKNRQSFAAHVQGTGQNGQFGTRQCGNGGFQRTAFGRAVRGIFRQQSGELFRRTDRTTGAVEVDALKINSERRKEAQNLFRVFIGKTSRDEMKFSVWTEFPQRERERFRTLRVVRTVDQQIP